MTCEIYDFLAFENRAPRQRFIDIRNEITDGSTEGKFNFKDGFFFGQKFLHLIVCIHFT